MAREVSLTQRKGGSRLLAYWEHGRESWSRFPESGAIFGFVSVLLFFIIATWVNTGWPPQIIDGRSIASVVTNAASQGIIAVGVTMLMISGEFDLSVGSTVALVNAVAAIALAAGLEWITVIALMLVLGGVLIYAVHLMRGSTSNWVGVAAAAGVLVWLRFPRLRGLAILLLVALASTGILSSTMYEFAGGDEEWARSGGSRLALIARVLEVTMRNPLTGLGPAAYRPYAAMEPLQYGRAFWVNPVFSSHNNWVDLFSYGGIVGLVLFCWFAVEVARTGIRLRAHYRGGFAAGYVNGILAAGAGALIIMLLADWMLPFVYNIGFSGFQASVMVWLFAGGLLALEQMMNSEALGGRDIEERQVGSDGAAR